MKDPFESIISEIWYRIRSSDTPTAVFAVNDKVFGVSFGGHKHHAIEHNKKAILIGVYTHSISRVDLSADISLVIDEIPDPDDTSALSCKSNR